MRRRTLLAVLSGGLAGCSGFDSDAPTRQATYGVPDTPEETPDPDLTRPRGSVRSVRSTDSPVRRLVLGVDPATPVPAGAQFTLAFSNPPTLDEPARVWIGLSNVADEPRTYSFDGVPPVESYRGYPADRPDRPGALLLPADRENATAVVPETADRGCWRATDDPTLFEGTVERTLISGGSLAREFLFVRPSGPETPCPFPERAIYRFGTDRDSLSFTVTVWDPKVRAPRRSRFSRPEAPLPEYERTRWFHNSTAVAPVYLEPDTERTALGETVAFTLENFSNTTFRIDPGAWDLYRREGEGWARVAGGETGSRSRPIPPGGRHGLELTFDNDGTTTPTESTTDGDARALVEGLDPGLYAVRHGTTDVSLVTQDPVRIGAGVERPTADSPTAYAALLELTS